MPKPKILIAGGGYADIPCIKAAKRLGYYVITSGNRPEELGHDESDEYCNGDFSNPSTILEIAEQHKVDAIAPACNDFSAISCAYAAEQMGLPGYDSYDVTTLLHHKDSYRAFAESNDIPTPRAKGFDSVESALSHIESFELPILIKPVDLTGGKGISKVTEYSAAKSALESAFFASKAKRIVVEEFVEGTKHGFSAILKSGKIIFKFTDNEHYYLNPYLVSGASYPSILRPQVSKELMAVSEKIAQKLKLVDGIFHVQFIVKNDRPIIIEICRRPPGDLYVLLVKLATGVDYPAQILKPYTGGNYDSSLDYSDKGCFLRHCIMANKNGTLKNLNYDRVKDNVVDEYIFCKPGDTIDAYMTAKLGILFLQFPSVEEMLRISDSLHQLISIKMT